MQFFGTGCLVREMRVPLLFFASLFFIMLRSTIHSEKPFEFARTPGKLPKEVVPIKYSVRFVPNIDNFTFTGSETVELGVHNPVHQLVLNALELKVIEASIDGKALPQSAMKIDEKNELLTLALPSQLATGSHTLALTFSGKINQQGQGLFYMRYQEQGTGAKKIALGTQFEATDARRLFPCWDEPAFRARFQLTAVVPENWLAVSNMPIESETRVNARDEPPGPPPLRASNSAPSGPALPGQSRMKQVRFATTPPMSSYLNVFVAGDLVTMAWWDNLWLNEGFASWMGTKCSAHFNPQWEVWLRRNFPRDPARRIGIAKEQAMEGDARSTTHPIQQPIATEAEANSAFDDITYRKGQSFLRMLESFLGENVFRDGIRKYMAAHKLSNSTTVDLWNALAEASGKPVVEIAAAWTEQPGFPVVEVARDASGTMTLTQG